MIPYCVTRIADHFMFLKGMPAAKMIKQKLTKVFIIPFLGLPGEPEYEVDTSDQVKLFLGATFTYCFAYFRPSDMTVSDYRCSSEYLFQFWSKNALFLFVSKYSTLYKAFNKNLEKSFYYYLPYKL